MRDGLIRRAIKRLALIRYTIDLSLTRLVLRAQGEPRYRLTGACNGCGRCCETPVIAVSRPVFHLRSLRWLTLTWHRLVNGFEYVSEDRRHKLFVFRCTHYDPVTKQCDSYDSRPGMCRDYPRNLAYSALPEFLPECGYSAVYKKGEQLRQALEKANLPPEKYEELVRKLYLEE
ncbi:YkgJ family cysteine cluster protein [Archangium violaceum]|uniref:YkgJ family cysteine cluster protein n=1 Tax=Archangium violaceum TaxID=83451 RepID=UPI00193B931D|nr:YkgJ family cysteine cluster protein [Archangium violaceum]QRK12177.1 YkgJ family cysteine cluster protein [Archangium violaceum]